MEDVPAPSFLAWIDQGLSAEGRDGRLAIATEKIAATVSWLLDCPPPGDGKIGPIGGGCMYHDLFCKEEAALEFFTLLALEVFANKARCLYFYSALALLRNIFHAGIEPSAWPDSARRHSCK